MSDDAKVPAFRSHSDSDDWRQHLYNQERMLEGQEQMKVVLESLLANQRQMAELAKELRASLDVLSDTMRESMKTTSGLVAGVIKVPIAMAVVAVASWAFMYAKEITEMTWLIMLGVAVFPWLGESITAIMKLLGVRQQTNNSKSGERP